MTNVGAGFTPAQNETDGFTPAQNGQPQGLENGHPQRLPLPNATVGDIVGAYKSLVENECLKIFKSKWAGAEVNPAPTMGKLWQRNYYEHVIRNEQSHQTISNYIINLWSAKRYCHDGQKSYLLFVHLYCIKL